MTIRLSIHTPKRDQEQDLIASTDRLATAAVGLPGFIEAKTPRPRA
jgi:hypothetical protein